MVKIINKKTTRKYFLQKTTTKKNTKKLSIETITIEIETKIFKKKKKTKLTS